MRVIGSEINTVLNNYVVRRSMEMPIKIQNVFISPPICAIVFFGGDEHEKSVFNQLFS